MATASDVASQQALVYSEQVNCAVGVDAVKGKLSVNELAAWTKLAAQCVHFTGKSPTLGLTDVMYQEGLGLVAELAWWRQHLTVLGAVVPTTDWGSAPKNVPTPGPGLLQQAESALGGIAPIVLVALFVLMRERR